MVEPVLPSAEPAPVTPESGEKRSFAARYSMTAPNAGYSPPGALGRGYLKWGGHSKVVESSVVGLAPHRALAATAVSAS